MNKQKRTSAIQRRKRETVGARPRQINEKRANDHKKVISIFREVIVEFKEIHVQNFECQPKNPTFKIVPASQDSRGGNRVPWQFL